MLFAIYQRAQYTPALEAALKANRAARATWAELAAAANGIYRNDVTFGPEYFQHGHWQDRLAAMDDDIADMEAMLTLPTGNNTSALKTDPKLAEQAMRKTLAKRERDKSPLSAGFHEPPASFRRGQPLVVEAHPIHATGGVRLRYRRVNQAEDWRMVEMEQAGKALRAEIPAAYTDSPFPLQYHFQIHAGDGVARLHPGLKPGWNGQPYFVVRQA